MARQTRWIIPGPGPDESIASLVGRAATKYGLTEQELVADLMGGTIDTIRSFDLDVPPSRVVHAIATAVGVPDKSLFACRLDASPRWLAPSARCVYCPECWAEDDAAGRPRGFRRQWASVLRPICMRHGRPLIRCLARDTEQPSLHLWGNDPASRGKRRECLDVLDKLGAALEATLFDGADWPRDWSESAVEARRVLLASALNCASQAAFPATSSLMLPTELAPYVHGPSHTFPPQHTPEWETFRALSDPGFRRGALWMAASRTIPGFDAQNWSNAPALVRQAMGTKTHATELARVARHRSQRATLSEFDRQAALRKGRTSHAHTS